MKRRFISLVALVLAVCLIVPLSACDSGDDGKVTLKVYNWGDYIDESVLDIFTEETGIEVIYDTFETNEDMFTKIKTAGSGTYDVVIPSDYMIKRMIDEGMLAKIDTSSMENYQYIGENYKNLEYDPNNEYSVPYMWGTVGILYNTTMVDDEVTSWDILWNEKYSRKIFMIDSVRDSIGITLKMLGYSLNSKNLDELDEAEAKLKEQKPLVLAYTADEVKDKMIAGEAALAVVYSGDAITCIEQNPDLAYAIPEEGTNLWFDAMCVLEGSEHKEEAQKFIDFMCREDIAEMNRSYINYSTPQTQVYDALPEEIQSDPLYYADDEIIANSEVFVDLGETVAYYEELWVRIVSG